MKPQSSLLLNILFLCCCLPVSPADAQETPGERWVDFFCDPASASDLECQKYKRAELEAKAKRQLEIEQALGVYYCITDRVAGIQGPPGNRYSGQISPEASLQRFTVKVARRDSPGVSSDGKLSDGRPWPIACRDYSPAPRFGFRAWEVCDTRFTVEFSDYILPMLSGDEPTHFHSDTEVFHLRNAGSASAFWFSGHLFGMDGLYVAEGRCSKFQGK